MKKLFKQWMIWALRAEAKAVIRKYKPTVIAITGSVGKTSAKDAVYAMLAQSEHVRKSAKSFNSEFGLPLTILGAPNAWNNPLRWMMNLLDGLMLIIFTHNYPRWLVLEVGADRPGDITSVAQWLPVTIAVITRLPEMPVHVEFFESPEQVAREKAALIDALLPDGTLVMYGGDARAPMLRERAGNKKVLTCGFSPDMDVRADSLEVLYESGKEHYPLGMRATLVIGETSAPVEVVGTIGAHSLLPLLSAAAVGRALGKSVHEIVEGIKGYEPPAGRMHLVRGVKNTIIIDDTYNSSPAAVTAGLETLGHVQKAKFARRIAVLGDMLELGRHSVEEHRKVGVLAAKSCNLLITVGFRARDIAQGALTAGMKEEKILQYEDSETAGEELAALLKEGDVVFVKGSQSMRMERAVLEMMANPEQAEKLLVRQDEEWIKR